MSVQTLNIGQSYRLTQIKNTEAEIARFVDLGIELIELDDMQAKLAGIGLKLDLSEKSYLNLYYNTSNENHYFEATTSPIDNKRLSAYNVNSEFYNKHLKGDDMLKTPQGLQLQKLRQDYFCLYQKRGVKYIISF